ERFGPILTSRRLPAGPISRICSWISRSRPIPLQRRTDGTHKAARISHPPAGGWFGRSSVLLDASHLEKLDPVTTLFERNFIRCLSEIAQESWISHQVP